MFDTSTSVWKRRQWAASIIVYCGGTRKPGKYRLPPELSKTKTNNNSNNFVGWYLNLGVNFDSGETRHKFEIAGGFEDTDREVDSQFEMTNLTNSKQIKLKEKPTSVRVTGETEIAGGSEFAGDPK